MTALFVWPCHKTPSYALRTHAGAALAYTLQVQWGYCTYICPCVRPTHNYCGLCLLHLHRRLWTFRLYRLTTFPWIASEASVDSLVFLASAGGAASAFVAAAPKPTALLFLFNHRTNVVHAVRPTVETDPLAVLNPQSSDSFFRTACGSRVSAAQRQTVCRTLPPSASPCLHRACQAVKS